MASDLDDARAAHAARAWDRGWHAFQRADAARPLDAADLERMRWCAGLTGRDAEMIGLGERLFQAWIEAGHPDRAARAAFWTGMRLAGTGEPARAGGWFARAGHGWSSSTRCRRPW